jgi:hypothetical protein
MALLKILDKESQKARANKGLPRISTTEALKQLLSRNGTNYALLQVASHLLGGISGLLAVRWLDPIEMGWWNTSQLIKVPLDATRLGVLSGLNREYPHLMGADQPEAAQRVLEVGLAHTLGTLALIQVILVVWLLSCPPLDTMLLLGIVAASSVWSLGYYGQFVRSMLRTPVLFGISGKIELAVAVIDAVAVVLVYKYGYSGLLARAVCTSMLTLVLLCIVQPVRVRPRWHSGVLYTMLRFGGRTYIANILVQLGQQADRLFFLASADGIKQLGLYTPSLICASYLQVVPGAIHSYFYPQAVESYGRNKNHRELAEALLQRIKQACLLMAIVSVGSAICIVLMIQWFLPGYSEGRTAALLVCLAGPFYPLRMWLSYHHALQRWVEYYVYTGLQIILPFAAMWILTRWLPLDIGVALGYVVSIALAGLVLTWQTLQHARREKTHESTSN